MATFFSGTDRNTLIEEGISMPHFLSLIVNNAGVYTAKITRRVKLETAKITYPTFGGELKSEDAEVTVNEYLEAFPLKIDIQEDTSIRDEVLERIQEIEEEKKRKTPGPIMIKGLKPYTQKEPTFPKTTPAQPTLFSQTQEEDWTDIKVPEDLAQKLLVQLITGSITTGYSDKFDIEKWCSSIMEKAFFRRFPDPQDLENWLDIYTEFLTWYTVWKEVDDVDGDVIAKAVASKLLDMCTALPANKILEAIMNKLKDIAS